MTFALVSYCESFFPRDCFFYPVKHRTVWHIVETLADSMIGMKSGTSLTRWLSLLSSLSLFAIGNTRYRSAPLFPPSRKQGFSTVGDLILQDPIDACLARM
ncbi:hypothetical protein H0G86_012695 [Trichoderma simmonsii]|uniref:Uncharacterized protein n=1 Tax=Trichoderma simmonsii TaxID=1491479 RepID=A0A8G0PM95_9HYPO|nr:hypothetical protein H0G86_012695 [Trichoderma simmonsii]